MQSASSALSFRNSSSCISDDPRAPGRSLFSIAQSIPERMHGLRIAEFHAQLMIEGRLPAGVPAYSARVFWASVVDAPSRFGVRGFELQRIEAPADYVELLGSLLFSAGVEDVDVDLEAASDARACELRFVSPRCRARVSWEQEGELVHPVFLEALDLMTMPQGRFVRDRTNATRFVGLYLPSALAAKADALLGELR